MGEEITNDTPDPAFVVGFNEGYTLAKHMPELADKLYVISSESERLAGFRNGREEYVLEKLHERMPEWLKDEPGKEQQKESKPDRGREDIEHDRE